MDGFLGFSGFWRYRVLRFRGLGLGILVLGFRGFRGFKIQGLGLRVFRYRVCGWGFRVLAVLGFRV